MRQVSLHVISAAWLAVVACGRPPSPTPAPPLPDSGDGGGGRPVDAGPDASPEAQACAALRAAGCVEGWSHCEEVLGDAERLHFVNFHVACLGRAGSAADLRACGSSVTCTLYDGGHVAGGRLDAR